MLCKDTGNFFFPKFSPLPLPTVVLEVLLVRAVVFLLVRAVGCEEAVAVCRSSVRGNCCLSVLHVRAVGVK